MSIKNKSINTLFQYAEPLNLIQKSTLVLSSRKLKSFRNKISVCLKKHILNEKVYKNILNVFKTLYTYITQNYNYIINTLIKILKYYYFN